MKNQITNEQTDNRLSRSQQKVNYHNETFFIKSPLRINFKKIVSFMLVILCSMAYSFAAPIAITTIKKVNVKCFGDATGSINITASGGTQPYSYLWSNGSTVEDMTGLAAGMYTVTVTDANGFTKTKGFTITQPLAALALTVTINGPDESTVAISGGTSPYRIYWEWYSTVLSDWRIQSALNNQTHVTTLVSGRTYKVVVKDRNGCMTESATFVMRLANEPMQTEGAEVSIYPNPTSGLFTITLDGVLQNENVAVAIYNIAGQVVLQSNKLVDVDGQMQINLSDQPKGIYNVQLIANGQLFSKKIIVD